MPDSFFPEEHRFSTSQNAIGQHDPQPRCPWTGFRLPDDDERVHDRPANPAESNDYTPDERQALMTLKAFQSNVKKLDNELLELIAAVSPLGASVAVHSSALRMRQHLAATLSSMFSNAAQRFPRHGLFRDTKFDPNSLRNMRLPFNVSLPPYPAPVGKLELHTELTNLSKCIDTFFRCLQEFTGHVDGLITDTVTLIRDDLKYIAQRVEEAGDQKANVALACAIFAHDVTPEIGSRLVELTKAISSVKHSSLPSLKFTHEYAVSNFTSMATVATFFSAVVATALQFPHEPHSSILDAFTSGCWLTSLVLSISSAFHSVWAASWQQAVYRFPRPRVLAFVQTWMTYAPICLLGASVMVFCAGLACFVISSQPKGVILAVTISLLCCTTGFGVCAAWFTFEFTAYFRYQGEFLSSFWEFLGLNWTSQSSPNIATDEPNIQPLPEAMGSLARKESQDSELLSVALARFRKLGQQMLWHIRSWKRQPEQPVLDAQARPIDLLNESHIPNSDSSLILYQTGDHKRRLVYAVKEIRRIPAQQSPVIKISFSPDALTLATSGSWDRRTHAFSLAHTSMTILSRSSANQIVWAPNGSLLAVRPRGSRINIYLQHQEETLSPNWFSNAPKYALSRPGPVESISWYPNSEALLSIERNEAIKLSLVGTVLERLPIDDMHLHAGVVLLCNPSLAQGQPIVKIPIAHNAIDISLTADRQLALISYEHKAPPQLWHFGPAANGMRLTLMRSFGSAHGEFAGPCALTGKNDEFVVGASKNGDVYIWDREVGTLLRHMKPDGHDGSAGISCISGSRAHDNCMFATGSMDGTVRLWQADTNPGSMRTGQTMIIPLPSPGGALGLSGIDQLPAADVSPLPSGSTVSQRTGGEPPNIVASPRLPHKDLREIES